MSGSPLGSAPNSDAENDTKIPGYLKSKGFSLFEKHSQGQEGAKIYNCIFKK